MKKIPGYIVYSFSTGFFISLIAGFIRHNPAGIVFFRAFISASLFTVIVYLCNILIKKYVPELLSLGEGLNIKDSGSKRASVGESSFERSSEDTGDSKGDENEIGTMVDYVVTDSKKQEESSSGSPGDLFHGKDGYVDFSGPKSSEDEVSGETRENETPVEVDQDKHRSSESEEESELPPIEELLDEEEEELVPSSEEEIVSEPVKTESKLTGGYIKIGDRKFPYDPEVFAKAIKKVMREDGNR